MSDPKPRVRSRPVADRRRATALEHQIQSALFDWRAIATGAIPLLELLHAIPNGAGVRHKLKMTLAGPVRYSPEGKKLKREGLTKGIPDVCWPVPRGRYHGAYIEHKRPGEKPSEEQSRKIRLLREQGYYVTVSCDPQYSIDILQTYWNLGLFWDDHGAQTGCSLAFN